MERRIFKDLIHWKDKQGRQPLVLQGARQVGKTHLLREFGRQCFASTVYVNLEADRMTAGEFEGSLETGRLLRFLEVYSGEKIKPEKTLIILDEIQSSPRALTALKYFSEQAPEYAVAAAGSLLGVAVHRQDQSYPVGKVDSLALHPLDFEEYLWALGKKTLGEEIQTAFLQKKVLPEALHHQALEIYRRYLVTGGMPAVVREHCKTGSLSETGVMQLGILNDYVADMAKYASASESVKIRAAFNSLPAQLAKDNKKFQYKTVQKGGSAIQFGPAIEWLEFGGLVYKSQRVTLPQIPLAAYGDLSAFKLYMVDVGLLGQKSGLPAGFILSDLDQNIPFLGALTENFVAQQLAARGKTLYYWESEGQAEIDFLLQGTEGVLPVEVKAGLQTRSRSLSVFRERYETPFSLRLSQKNFGWENGIFSLPLYAAYCL